MPKQKVSVTLTPELLQRAQRITDSGNLSELLDQALEALIDRELERQWLAGQSAAHIADSSGLVVVDVNGLPWEG